MTDPVTDPSSPTGPTGPTGPTAGSTDVEVAIIGSGFAGIGMGLELARRGEDSFVILEREGDIGGTWRDNRYPGVACDIPSHLYCFSFAPKLDWSRRFAPGAEIQAYLQDCAASLRSQIHLDTEVTDASWQDGAWTVSTPHRSWRARALIVATGRLSEPRIPGLEGMLDFPGPVFHAARWDDDADLAGRRVGIVGSGCTAAQLVPALTGHAGSQVLFQRSAPWVVPREDHGYSPAELARFRDDPQTVESSRQRAFAEMERGSGARHRVQPDLDDLRCRASAHLAAQIADPLLRAQLTPDYEIGCKRVIVSDDFYPALSRPDVTLEPSALDHLEGSVAVSRSGARHELDAIILATGFISTRPPIARRISGRGGRRLCERWAGGMFAYASTTVHGFPNMFVLDGPNASLGHNSAVHMIETQIRYVLGALEHLHGHPTALEVSLEAEGAYVAELEAMSAGTVWLEGGCSSWYVDDRSGRLSLLWPGTARAFRERNGTFDPRPYLAVAT